MPVLLAYRDFSGGNAKLYRLTALRVSAENDVTMAASGKSPGRGEYR